MAFNVTVTPIVQEVEVNASVTPYEVDISVIDGQDLTLTTVGTSGAATYNQFTGLLNIPNYSTDLSGVVPIGRTLTINGTSFDLSANRSWIVGDLRSDESYSNPTWLTALAWSKITGTPTTLGGYGITDAVPSSRQLTINGVAFDLSANRTWTIPTHDAVTIGTANGLSLAGQVLSLGLASAGVTGALSGTDWTTFNNKQNALTNPVTGTGVSGQVAFWNGTTTQTGSNNLFWDNTNSRLGIGTNVPDYRLTISDSATIFSQRIINTATNGRAGLFLQNNSTGYAGFGVYGTAFNIFTFRSNTVFFASNDFFIGAGDLGTGQIIFARGSGLSSESMRIFSTGNLAINTTTDAGFRLDVNGTARVQGNLTTNLTAGSVPFIGASGLLTQNNSNLFWDNVNGRLGIGTNAPAYRLHNVGTSGFDNGASADAITVLNDGFIRWQQTRLRAAGSFFTFQDNSFNNRVTFNVASGGNFVFNTGGNLLLNTTTDAGFRLDVNGTARVQSTLKVGEATATNSSAVLDVDSTTRGFLPPRMTTAQRDLIATPAAGLIVYNTSTNKHQGYNGTTWNDLY